MLTFSTSGLSSEFITFSHIFSRILQFPLKIRLVRISAEKICLASQIFKKKKSGRAVKSVGLCKGLFWQSHTRVGLFCSLAVLDPRVSHTMDALSPFIPVLCHSDWLFHGQSCPRLDVVYLGRAWPSSPTCTWHVPCIISFSRQLPGFLMAWP